jgi:hypothetical protein
MQARTLLPPGILVAAGEVFDEHFDGLEPGMLRGSAEMGFRSVGLADHRFELLLALGRRPFDDGGAIDSCASSSAA